MLSCKKSFKEWL